VSIRFLRPALLVLAVAALAGCGGSGGDRDESDGGLNVTTNTSAPANTVEEAPAVTAPVAPSNTAEASAPVRNVRDGPGEERGPEYEGARSAATALPSQGDDGAPADTVPPPPPAPPGSPQNLVSDR
jgi:hypothetical protein